MEVISKNPRYIDGTMTVNEFEAEVQKAYDNYYNALGQEKTAAAAA